MKIELNNDYYLIRCKKADVNSIGILVFDPPDTFVIKIDQGERFATRFLYTTLFAKKRKLYFKCGSAIAAIKQALIEAYPKEALKDIYFKIVKK